MGESVKNLKDQLDFSKYNVHYPWEITYVERSKVPDEEIKNLYDIQTAEFNKQWDKVNEESPTIYMNFDNSPVFESPIQNAGTYVVRDGKLVEGNPVEWEHAVYKNWYCSNADPEDIMWHWELMDRMNYRGPQWDGIGRPKMAFEEQTPFYHKTKKEERPDTKKDFKAPKQEFEEIVR